MSTTTEEPVDDQKLFFIIAALMFFAIPIRYPDPETRTQKEFRNFIITFNRTYHGNATEYQRRYQLFKETFDMLEDIRHDKRPVFGINRYADVSKIEFKKRYLLASSPDYVTRPKRKISVALQRYNKNNFGVGSGPLPLRVDWRKKGIITPIRDQGPCGSCYAQSAIASIESMHALKWNLSTADELSVQQIIDCAGILNFGCQGGDTCNLLQMLHLSNVTILPKGYYEKSNPRKACHARNRIQAAVRTARVTDYTCFSFVGQEPEMLTFLAFRGPLIAAVSALPWKQYVGGVIKRDCTGPADHAVQIVGYDLGGPEQPHFIVRNSWGTSFGHRGYAKIAIGGNVCGIAEEVSSVTVD